MDRTSLLDYGIEYDRGLKNCMDDVVFYKRILAMFLEDTCFTRASAALAARDYKELFSRMHEIKGVSGNTALMGLYTATLPLVELLRGGGAPEEERVRSLFADAATAYERTCQGIRLLLAEG